MCCANNNQPSLDAASDGICLPSTSTDPGPLVLPPHATGQSSPSVRDLHLSNGSCKARVLYNYNAASSSELSLQVNEVRSTAYISAVVLIILHETQFVWVILLYISESQVSAVIAPPPPANM